MAYVYIFFFEQLSQTIRPTTTIITFIPRSLVYSEKSFWHRIRRSFESRRPTVATTISLFDFRALTPYSTPTET